MPALIGFILLFTKCSSESNEDAGYIIINGMNYALTYGLVSDYGINQDMTYRNYWIKFQSSEGEEPSHFILFKLNSTSLTDIGKGTYEYKVLPSDSGEFSWTKVGYELQYDVAGEKIDGTILLDSEVKEGHIIITDENEVNRFEFNIVFEKNNTIYTVTGEFSDILHEGSVSYTDKK